ncbi:hypothetical protein [Enterococcus mundtii]|uniref:hypothetical protein n=1 Tax=Enterococcus TaxID=1350 RepID=UPI0032DEF0ED
MNFRKTLLKAVTLSSVLLLGSNYAFATENATPDPNETNTPLEGTLIYQQMEGIILSHQVI